MAFKTITVQQAIATGTLLADKGEVCTLVQTDSQNFVTLGSDQTVQPGDTDSVLFGPGQIFSTDGTERVFANVVSGITVAILKYPGVIQFSTPPVSPSATPPLIATAVATNGNTVDLIGGTAPIATKGYAIQLITCSLSMFLTANGAVSGFNTQDAIIDNTGFEYLPLQGGLSSSGGLCFPTLSVPMNQALVPPGRKLQLANGGSSGNPVFHQCAAMVAFYLVNV